MNSPDRMFISGLFAFKEGTMRVSELIDKLSMFPSNCEIVISDSSRKVGYKGGLKIMQINNTVDIGIGWCEVENFHHKTNYKDEIEGLIF